MGILNTILIIGWLIIFITFLFNTREGRYVLAFIYLIAAGLIQLTTSYNPYDAIDEHEHKKRSQDEVPSVFDSFKSSSKNSSSTSTTKKKSKSRSKSRSTKKSSTTKSSGSDPAKTGYGKDGKGSTTSSSKGRRLADEIKDEIKD